MNTKPAVLSEVWDSNPWLFTFIFWCKYLSHEFLCQLFPEILYPQDRAQVLLDIYLNLYYQFNLSLKLSAQGVSHSYVCCIGICTYRASELSPGVKCIRLRGGSVLVQPLDVSLGSD